MHQWLSWLAKWRISWWEVEVENLLAFIATEPEDGCSQVVFAHNAKAAELLGEQKLGCFEGELKSCVREPAFDQYAPGPVPLSAALAADWSFTCSGCSWAFDSGGRLNADSDTGYLEGEDDEFAPLRDRYGLNYCSHQCMMTAWANARETRARVTASIMACEIEWPAAKGITVLRGTDGTRNGICRFELPGLRHIVRWDVGSAEVRVQESDLEAFTRLYSRKRSTSR